MIILVRERIRKFLKRDGEKESDVRALTTRCRKYVPQIKRDLALVETFMSVYDSHFKKD